MNDVGPVYSPSSTELWMTCPLKRQLSKLVKPTVSTRRDIAAALGTAVGAGLAAHYQGETEIAAAEVARATAQGETHLLPPPLPALVHSLTTVPERAAKLVTKYIAKDPIPKDWKIVAVEQKIGPERCRPDLLVELPRADTPTVVDFKVKPNLPKFGLTNDFIKFRTRWQLYHYAWRVGTRTAIIVLIVEAPKFDVITWPFTFTQANLDRWLETAQGVWAEMRAEEMGLRPVRQAAKHVDEYGPCEFYEDCFGG